MSHFKTARKLVFRVCYLSHPLERHTPPPTIVRNNHASDFFLDASPTTNTQARTHHSAKPPPLPHGNKKRKNHVLPPDNSLPSLPNLPKRPHPPKHNPLPPLHNLPNLLPPPHTHHPPRPAGRSLENRPDGNVSDYASRIGVCVSFFPLTSLASRVLAARWTRTDVKGS